MTLELHIYNIYDLKHPNFAKCHYYLSNSEVLHKLVKKSSLTLVKVKIFLKLLNTVQIKAHQENQTHLELILTPNV